MITVSESWKDIQQRFRLPETFVEIDCTITDAEVQESAEISGENEAVFSNTATIGEELTAEEENIWNEIYLALGIAHQTYKNERMIEDEVRSQKEPSEFVRLDSLNCRREAARKLNDRFGEYLDKEIKVIWDYDNASENYNYLYNIKEQVDSEAVGEMKPRVEDRGE